MCACACVRVHACVCVCICVCVHLCILTAVCVCRLLLCVVVGFVAGITVGGAKRADNWSWPTEQMTSRGQPEALAVGLLIALPSGVGVALSKTDDGYAGGLVGVAISASLLPPAVNAGICWGLAPFSALEAKELGIMGGYSLLLTIVNIVAIIFAASLVSHRHGASCLVFFPFLFDPVYSMLV